MGAEEFKRGAVSILLVLGLAFSMILVAPLASSGDWVNRPAPGGTIIQVTSGENFLIRHTLEWDEGADGSYTVTISWANYDNHPDENFTFLMAEAYFTTGAYAGESIKADITLSQAPLGTDTIWALSVSCPADQKDPRDGQFNVDIWMGAWGVGGVLHIPTDNHPIPPPPPANQFAGVIVIESSLNFWDRPPITIKVLGRGVGVSISPSENNAPPGGNITFTVTVINKGNVPDNYVLKVSDNAVPSWAPSLSENLLNNIGPGENKTTTLTVTVPEDAALSTEDNITVTATSQADNTVKNSASTIARAAEFVPVKVSISPLDNSGAPRETLIYTVTVMNMGDVGDNYNLEASDNADWMLSLDDNLLTIPAGGSQTTKLRVIIPDVGDVFPGEEDRITVTATSSTYPTVSDSATCIASVAVERRVKVSISPPENSGVPGENVRFTVTVTNTGNVTDRFNLGASDNAVPSWAPKVSPTSLAILAGDNDTATVSVIIPAGTASGMKDKITVKATSINDNTVENYATCIATAATIRGVEVFISLENKIGAPGENVRFTVTVINTGNVTDNYALTVIDNENWGPTLSENLLVNVGMNENKPVTLAVKIPENALPDAEDEITVTATSQGDPSKSDFDMCIAKVVTPSAPILKSPADGTTTNDNTPTFEWTVGLYADNHRLLIDNDPDFTSPIENRLFRSTGNTYTPVPEDSLPDENYSWKVVAIRGLVENQSSVRTFVIDTVPPAAPSLISPIDGTITDDSTPTFDWSDVPGAENYDLLVDDNPDFSSPEIQVTVPVSTYTPTAGLSDDNYSWKVRARDAANNVGDWSSVWTLRIKTIARTVEVSISPENQSGPPERVLTFTVTVTNTGNVRDNYNLAASDNADWVPSLDNNLLTIQAGDNRTTTLRVIVDERASSGEEDKITVTATSQADPTVSGSTTCIARAVIERKVDVSISPSENSGVPGENVRFTVTVTNKGNVTDSYNLVASDNAVPSWAPTVSPTSLTILAGDNGTATVSIIIPEGTAIGMKDNITVKATSINDNTVSDNATCIATAVTMRRVEVSISPPENSGAPGETLTFKVTVKNIGNALDNYDLTADDNTNWTLTLLETLTNVSPGENRTVNLSVGIPDDAENSTRDNVTVTVTSHTDNTVNDSASCIAKAVTTLPPPPEYGVQVSISPNDQKGLPEETLTFTVTVKNTGNAEDSYDLVVSDDPSWGATLAQNLLLAIPAGGSRTTTVSVTVPSDATEDELTYITVSATSRGDPTLKRSATSRAIAEKAPGGPGVELPIPLAISVLLIGAAIIVPAYLLRERRKKSARRRVFRDVGFGFR